MARSSKRCRVSRISILFRMSSAGVSGSARARRIASAYSSVWRSPGSRRGSYIRRKDAASSYSMYCRYCGVISPRYLLNQEPSRDALASVMSSSIRAASWTAYKLNSALRSLVEMPTAPVSIRMTLDRLQSMALATCSCVICASPRACRSSVRSLRRWTRGLGVVSKTVLCTAILSKSCIASCYMQYATPQVASGRKLRALTRPALEFTEVTISLLRPSSTNSVHERGPLADVAVPADGQRGEDGGDRDAPGDGLPGRGGDRSAQHQAPARAGQRGHRVDPDPGLQPARQDAGLRGFDVQAEEHPDPADGRAEDEHQPDRAERGHGVG